MLHHRTTDPAQKAASIADKEAEKVWQKTGDYALWSKTWIEVYRQSIIEFCIQG